MLEMIKMFRERTSQKGSLIMQLARGRKSEMNAKRMLAERKIHKQATNRTPSLQPDFHSGYLLEPPRTAFTRDETGIFGTWIPCITAQTMVRHLVCVVKASI